ncbi:hypothetical protein [Acinetobacter sp.]
MHDLPGAVMEFSCWQALLIGFEAGDLDIKKGNRRTSKSIQHSLENSS